MRRESAQCNGSGLQCVFSVIALPGCCTVLYCTVWIGDTDSVFNCCRAGYCALLSLSFSFLLFCLPSYQCSLLNVNQCSLLNVNLR
mgnify:CR=1 FL=1